MNKKQKRIFWIGGIIIFLRLIFPVLNLIGRGEPYGTYNFAPIFETCGSEWYGPENCEVDLARTAMQAIAIVLIFGMYWFSSKDKKGLNENIALADEEGSEDELYEKAVDLVVKNRKASASFLQMRMQIGYSQAARILDKMEENGIIGPGDGAKPREIL